MARIEMKYQSIKEVLGMSVYNPYVVSYPFELTTSGKNMWGMLPLDIRKKILHDVHSSYTITGEDSILIPDGLLKDEQIDLYKKHPHKIQVTQKITFTRVMLTRFNEELEITLSRTVNETPHKLLMTADEICKTWGIDKNNLNSKVQEKKTLSGISKVKMMTQFDTKCNIFEFVHKKTHKVYQAPGKYLSYGNLIDFLGEFLEITEDPAKVQYEKYLLERKKMLKREMQRDRRARAAQEERSEQKKRKTMLKREKQRDRRARAAQEERDRAEVRASGGSV